MSRFTRRRLLASVGVGGLAASGLATSRDGPGWSAYTYAGTAEGDDRVRVAWYETYNGTLQEHQGGTNETDQDTALDPDQGPTYVPEVRGPVIDLAEILPGDRGRLAVGLSPAEDTGPLAIDLSVTIDRTAEGGRTEPEVTAGDSSPDDGELADAVQATLWLDEALPACDGVETGGDIAVASGSLSDVGAALADGFRLCEDCFGAVGHRCLGFRWELPASVGNRVQSDAVAFSLLADVQVADGGEGT